MAAQRNTRRVAVSVLALAISAGIMLALAGAAIARPADAPHHQAVHDTAAPVVTETLLRPDRGLDTIALVLIGLGACAALLGAGYLGARIALRQSPATARPGRPSSTSG